MADDIPDDQAPQWDSIGQQFGAGLANAFMSKGIEKDILNVLLQREGATKALVLDTLTVLAAKIGAVLHDLEEPFFPIIAAMAAPSVQGLFGAEVSPADFSQKMGQGAGAAAARSIVDGFMKAVGTRAAAGEIAPGPEGATALAAAAVAASLESTFNSIVPEILSDLIPDSGHFTGLTELPENIIRALGVGRLVRTGLRPLINTTCATPMKWYIDKKHRPTLLGAGEVARQVARQRWTIDQAKEELARAGYSDDRIEALLNSVAKFHSVTDVYRLVRVGQWSPGAALVALRDAGYDDAIASEELLLEKLKAIEAFDREMATAAVDAYAAGRIDEGTLAGFCSGTTLSDQEKAQHIELAKTKRLCDRKPLTPAEAAAAVEAGVLSFVDYREALRIDNRTEDAITVLELLLRGKVDAKTSAAEHRAQLEKEKAEAAAKKAADALAKKAKADAAAALAQLGPPAPLEDAYIRGLVSIDRVEQIFTARYDADAVATLVALLEAKRQAYLDQQAKADAAKISAATRGIDVGQLEAAVLQGVITPDEYGRRLGELTFDGGDVAILVGTVQAKLDAQHAREAAHDQAVAAAKIKHVDLVTVETLVRRGHRGIGDFTAVLRSLGYDDVAQAALVERLQIQIADDAHAAQLRADAAAKLAHKGLSLDQVRRAVILGFQTVQEYAGALLKGGVTPDAVAVLVQEVEYDRSQAAAAAARRADAEKRSQSRDAPLTDVHRAARLGLIPVALYTARLTAEHYTADALALELDLLTTEIADVQAARKKREAADAKLPDAGLSLQQTAAAVTRGELPMSSYTERARALGFAADDAAVLTRVLQDEIDAVTATRARKAQLAEADPPLELKRADVEKAVTSGLKTIDDYRAWLLEEHYADDDAALLVAELQGKIDRTPPPA